MEREDNMNLEQFGNKICSALKEAMGTGYEIAFREVTKNNGVRLHGVIITGKESNVSPTVYIDELYEEFEAGRAIGDIVYDILCIYQKNAREINVDMDFFTQYAQAESRILYKLIHRESNDGLLGEIPYVAWNDLAIVFYYAFEDERFGKATILIKNSHLAMWGIDVPALYEAAKTNMLRLRPEELMPVRQLIQEFLEKNPCGHPGVTRIAAPDGTGVTLASGTASASGSALMSDSASAPGTAMYVLSNCDRVFGASAMLYSGAMKRLAGELDRNLIILPSSVHEVILVPDDGITEKEFYREMVREVNDTQVEPEERLSYNVYYYDRVLGKISILE